METLFWLANIGQKLYTFLTRFYFSDSSVRKWSRREYPCHRPHSAAISVWLLPCEWTCTADGRPITADQRRRSRDFPLNAQHPLHHDGDTQRGFSWVRLTLRDFTFPPHWSRLDTFKKPVGLSCSQRILLRILLTGLTVSSLLCKLKYFSQTFVLVLSIQSGFGSCPISCWTKNFWG